MNKFFKCIKLLWKIRFGEPNDFDFVSAGQPVGPELKVVHLTFHDMAEWACRCKLTEEVILNDLDANAIKVISFERIDDYNGITTFQPCKI